MFETIRLALSLLPLIIQAVTALEQQFPESGLGKMKLSLILETVRSIAGDTITSSATLEKLVNTVVSVLNTFGVFKKATT